MDGDLPSAVCRLPSAVSRAPGLLAATLLLLATAVPALAQRATLEEVVVRGARRKAAGGGLIAAQTVPHAISTISSQYVASQASVQNAYQYIKLAPGAMVSTADPFGLSEQFSINVHGLGQDELGYVLEGMPVNDIGYYVGYPSQFIDSENIDEVSLQQGTVDLDSPALSAAGGLVNITMLDPSARPGGLADFSYGSYNTEREFLRLDTGAIGDSGVRAFASYSRTDSDQWRGPGRVKRQHVDFKILKEWGAGNRVTLSGEWHDGITPTYTRPTLEQYQQFGTGFNYDSTFYPGDTNYWKQYIGTFRIVYLSAPARLVLADDVTLNLTPYWQYGYGNSPFGATLDDTAAYQGAAGPYTVTIPNYAQTGGAVMANFEDLQYRAGLVAKITFTKGANSVVLGDWYDFSDESDIQSYSYLSPNGAPPDIWTELASEKIKLPNGQQLLDDADTVKTQTNAPFVADTLSLLGGRLSLEAGLKFVMISRDGTNNVPGPQYRANINDAEPLPRFSASYRIDPRDQVFVSASTNFRTPSEQTFFNQYFDGALFAVANTDLKPEYSIEEEAGYRYGDAWLTGSATFFNYNFTDRQIASLGGAGGTEQISINAGGQTTRGVDVELGARPWHAISPYVSGEYLHATTDDNLDVGGVYLPTAGKIAVRSPKLQTALGLTYDDGTFFGSFDVKYTASQYATFVDDEKIPAITTADLGFGYRLPSIGLRARPELKLNLINLGGAYLSGVATPTANAKTQLAQGGTPIAGTAPTYYVAAGLAAIFTLKQAF